MDPSTSAAALRLEIARLTGAINRRKSEENKSATPRAQILTNAASRSRSNVYVNPNYKAPPLANKPGPPPSSATPSTSMFKPQIPSVPPSTVKRDVIIGGVAFQSSGRSLVRKDVPKSAPPTIQRPATIKPSVSTSMDYIRQKPARVYKPKGARGTRRRPANRNMTLNNTRRPYQSSRISKRTKLDKPCPRFTTTGSCNRGLTCMYQHDPSKIAICWNFLQGTCPNTSDTCNLSHDPTPNRTPLCVHFANNGRCTRQNCPFPHVRVGQRQGICRDFAVLGYCEKGLDCDKQHVRECPDFAEKGACTTKGCKLPHVIRANRKRATGTIPSTTTMATSNMGGYISEAGSTSGIAAHDDTEADVSSVSQVAAEDAQLGDEYISLTFHESDSEEDTDNDEEDEDEDEDEDDDDVAEQNEESDQPSVT